MFTRNADTQTWSLLGRSANKGPSVCELKGHPCNRGAHQVHQCRIRGQRWRRTRQRNETAAILIDDEHDDGRRANRTFDRNSETIRSITNRLGAFENALETSQRLRRARTVGPKPSINAEEQLISKRERSEAGEKEHKEAESASTIEIGHQRDIPMNIEVSNKIGERNQTEH